MPRVSALLLFAPLGLPLAVTAACSSQNATVFSLPVNGTGTETATATTTATGTSKPLFSDSFDQGYEANWTPASGDGPVIDAEDGNNAIVSLDATQNDFSRMHCNSGGDKFDAEDLTASVQVRIDATISGSSSRTVRLDVRQTPASENIFYAVGALVSSDDGTVTKAGLYKKVEVGPGDYTICQLAKTGLALPAPVGTWLSMKIRVQDTTTGVHLDGYVNGTAVSYDDDCQTQLVATNGQTVNNGGCLNGDTGLGIQVEGGIKASVDDVVVAP